MTVDYEAIDPGIRAVVHFLNTVCALNTTDSGDGVSKLVGDGNLPFPHVFAVVQNPDELVKKCQKTAVLLWEQGVKIVPTPEHMVTLDPGSAVVECSFNAADGIGIVQVLGLDDAGLALARGVR